MAVKELVGLKFGTLTVLRYAGSYSWVCLCSACGMEKTVRSGNLPGMKSCGCLRGANISKALSKHGRTNTPEFSTWTSMVRRCAAGASGYESVSVCDRWLGSPEGFLNFLSDMGPRPAGTEIDRIDGNGNYEPGNCRWATHAQNSRNTRSRRTATKVSKYKGVYPHRSRKSGGWIAQIMVNGKIIHLGVFDGEVDAARAYDAAAIKHYGEYACLNFSEGTGLPSAMRTTAIMEQD